ncbi:Leucine-rich repeat [Trinorchestia longiramus]|nr:Leucine-rich repeat [Trinorchestia longiramus]
MAITNIRDKLDEDQLDLSMMSLKEVPLKEIASIPRATTLDLSSNLLKSLPEAFGSELSHLIKLDLSSNKLTSLPQTFHLLVNLKHLDLYNNQLKDLPPSLHHLKYLRFLDIKNNPLNPELQKVVGQCLTQKECESAAKRLIAHFTREKNIVLNQMMANKAKKQQQQQQQQRDEAESVRQRNDKKSSKKEKHSEKKQPKSKSEPEALSRGAGTSGGSFASKSSAGGSNKAARRSARGSNNGGNSGGSWCSCMGLVNLLLMVSIVTAAGWCLHLHVEGDYSWNGLQAAVPRLQGSLYRLQNLTAEALQPQNLRKTGIVVYESVGTSLGYVSESVQKAAYSAQEYLEVYTGDLTPYTSQVSRYSRKAYDWSAVQCGVAYNWLLAQDWEGMWDATVAFLSAVWNKLEEWWTELLKNPTVRSAWEAVCHYTAVAVATVRHYLHSLFIYLQNNGPVWVDMVRDNTMSAVTSIKDSVQSILK